MLITISELVEEKILEIRGQHVIIDSDVAALYNVETKRINEAVKNNPDKFPSGYYLELDSEEKDQLVENFDRFEKLKHSTTPPKAFTERGMYMLATILKSAKATETTLAIIDTFSKVREIARTIKQLPKTPQNTPKYQQLLHKTGELIADLVVPEELEDAETEATIEVNLAVVKFKYSVKRKNKK